MKPIVDDDEMIAKPSAPSAPTAPVAVVKAPTYPLLFCTCGAPFLRSARQAARHLYEHHGNASHMMSARKESI